MMKKIILYCLIGGFVFGFLGALMKLNQSEASSWLFGISILHQVGLFISLVIWFAKNRSSVT